MITEGRHGRAPDWYWQIRAADRLNCSPWELEEQSLVWTWRALLAEQAEGKAADAAAKRARRKG